MLKACLQQKFLPGIGIRKNMFGTGWRKTFLLVSLIVISTRVWFLLISSNVIIEVEIVRCNNCQCSKSDRTIIFELLYDWKNLNYIIITNYSSMLKLRVRWRKFGYISMLLCQIRKVGENVLKKERRKLWEKTWSIIFLKKSHAIIFN